MLKRSLLAAAFAAMTATGAYADPLKVAFVYVGPVGDFGWSYQHDQGRKAVEAAFGDKVETTFVESVAEGPDAERVIRQLAASGNSLIFTTSFGYMDPTLKVAKQFPDVKFEHATGYKRADNVSTYSAKFYQGRYILGVIAGRLSKTGKMGYIGSFPIPEVVRGINSFTLGVQSVRPDAEVSVVWANTWYDPGKEADAAKSLIAGGADMIVQHTDSPAAAQAAENSGADVFVFGQASDMHNFAPNKQLTAIIDNWAPYYVHRVKAALDGTWESTDTWGGLAEGEVQMAPYFNMPYEVAKEASNTEYNIRNGLLHPFAGPLVDRDGTERVKAGEIAEDGMLLGMDWFVKGVKGDLPK